MSRIVLASSSPRRRELLARAGIRFTVIEPAEEMAPPPGMSSELAVQLIARAKAISIAADQPPGSFVIGADTMVVGPEGALGKPGSPERATSHLTSLRNRRHAVLTGICVVSTGDDREALGVSRSSVLMRDYSDIDIERYVASGEPLDRAGGYAIQGGGGDLVASLVGRVDTVVGIDVALTLKLLAEAGYPDPLPSATDVSVAPPRAARRSLSPMRAPQRV